MVRSQVCEDPVVNGQECSVLWCDEEFVQVAREIPRRGDTAVELVVFVILAALPINIERFGFFFNAVLPCSKTHCHAHLHQHHSTMSSTAPLCTIVVESYTLSSF